MWPVTVSTVITMTPVENNVACDSDYSDYNDARRENSVACDSDYSDYSDARSESCGL